MPIFLYEAKDARGRSVSGSVEAPDANAVVRDLRNIRYTVTAIKEKPDYLKAFKEFFKRFEHVDLYALAIFTRQFAVLFNSGISTVRSLDSLGRQTLNGALSRAVNAVHDDVRMGYTLAKAMGKHPGVFDATYLAMVKAGEMSGAMGEIMERLANLQEREVSLRGKMRAATTYPIVVFVACCIVTAIMVIYVFPTFVGLFQGLSVELPLITRSLMWITNVVGNPIVVAAMAVALVVCIYLFRQYVRTKRGRRHVDSILLNMWLFGPIVKKVALSRFCRTLGTLLSSGIPVVHSLEIVSGTVGNAVVGDIILELEVSLKSGMRLSQPMREYSVFPPMLSQMVAVGEETGGLPSMLDKLADFYDMEVEQVLDSLTSMLEPLMIGFMGLVVGYVLLAVFIPVYDLIAKF